MSTVTELEAQTALRGMLALLAAPPGTASTIIADATAIDKLLD